MVCWVMLEGTTQQLTKKAAHWKRRITAASSRTLGSASGNRDTTWGAKSSPRTIISTHQTATAFTRNQKACRTRLYWPAP